MEIKAREQQQQTVARDALLEWQRAIHKNCYTNNLDFVHLIQSIFPLDFARLHGELEIFAEMIMNDVESLVENNHQSENLPQLKRHTQLGKPTNIIINHPSYLAAGEIIYQSQLLKRMSKTGGLTECLAFLFLSAHVGEAGHNCPIACSAGLIRILQRVDGIPKKDFYLQKLTSPDFFANYTGAQFITEIQGGCDVGLNAVSAESYHDHYKLRGEKWFCSNAGADLFFVTARYDAAQMGTKGLALFLVPAQWQGRSNNYRLRRLKDKLGTRTLPTGEIVFNGAHAYLVGELENSFNLLLDHVIHLSRLFNSICVLGMARRAYDIAYAYSQHRIAFSYPIIHYPLIQETLAKIKAENNAMLAAIFATARMQDSYDLDSSLPKERKLLLRLLVNMQKYLTAKVSLVHIQQALRVLAGNGTIENFSSIPRLLKDCIICDNWEGTHNILRVQLLKDIQKYAVDVIFLEYIQFELQQIDRHAEPLKQAFETLQTFLVNFKKLDATLQALQIRLLLDRMCYLYCALMLLKDALNQKEQGVDSKLACYHYYCRLHLYRGEENLGDAYLNLVTAVLAS